MTKQPIDFTAGDDLSDLLGGAAPVAPTAAPPGEQWARIRSYADQAPAAKAFEITCHKCEGRGRFISYSGRDVGPCYTCKGAGKLSRKTAPAQLERAKEHRVEQAQAIRQEAAPQIAWIEKTLARGDKLPATFADIMRNCLVALQAGRILSEGRQGVIDRGMARDAAWAAAWAAQRTAKVAWTPTAEADAMAGMYRQEEAAKAVPQAPVVDVSNIAALFVRAQQAGLKRFKLRFTGVFFEQDKGNSALIWVSESGYGSAKYGRIADGVFKPGRDLNAEVIKLISGVAADPLAAGIAYAQVTASCSVCGRHLVNQDSVDAGLGPICAGRLNRPGLKFVEVKEF